MWSNPRPKFWGSKWPMQLLLCVCRSQTVIEHHDASWRQRKMTTQSRTTVNTMNI